MGTDRLIYIRADGNQHIASGHLMRCFSIAEQCRILGMQVCFLVSDQESFDLLTGILSSAAKQECGSSSDHFSDRISAPSPAAKSRDAFRIHQLQTARYDDPDRELPEIGTLLSRSVSNENILYLIDSYYLTEKYLLALKPLARTIYLDDLRLFDYPVDLLINYDVIPDTRLDSYKAAYRNAGRLLLGSAYAPLRRQFQNRKISVKERVKNVLITTGGSDPCHFCLQFIEKLKNPEISGLSDKGEITFHIVIGKLNADRDILHSLAVNLSCIQLHENITDMASLMMHCDLAISAAGTTLYELCALGIPTLCFTMADNQLTAAKAFQETEAIFCAGDLRGGCEGVLQSTARFIAESTYAERKSLHNAMRRLVDGSGARRIAEAIRSL